VSARTELAKPRNPEKPGLGNGPSPWGPSSSAQRPLPIGWSVARCIHLRTTWAGGPRRHPGRPALPPARLDSVAVLACRLRL